MATFAAQKIHEAEAHIAAIDRELLELGAALPYADSTLRRQVRDARSLLIQDRVRTLVSLQRLELPSPRDGTRGYWSSASGRWNKKARV